MNERVADFKVRIATLLRGTMPPPPPPPTLRKPTDHGYFPPTLSGMTTSLRACGKAEAAFARSLTKTKTERKNRK